MVFVFIAYFDSSVRTPAIFAKQIKLNLISMINFMSMRNKSYAEIFTRREDLEQSRNKSDMSVFKESFRKLRYEIEVSNKKIILFASTKKGQGKTTIIQCLAHIFSLSKKRILIIDTNFCNNDLTVQMNAPALIEQLEYHKASGKTPTEHVFEHAKKSSEGEIYIIGSEPGNYTPEEILPSENILQYLQELKNDFDYIFLEGPPLNDFSDAKELSGYAEGVVGVFSATDMIRQIDKESIRFFKDLKEKYIGSILNMVDLKDVNTA
jgi:Mrp family chromosome partitioning ATPase